MNIDAIGLSKKLMFPVVVTTIALIILVAFGATKLSAISADAEVVITQRDKAAFLISNAVRYLYQAQNYDYVSVTNDSDTVAGKIAVDGFAPALEQAKAYLQDAADLLPDRAQQLVNFKSEVERIEPKLMEAYKIGVALPGVEHAVDLKPEQLAEIGRAVGILAEYGAKIDQLATATAKFNEAVLKENNAQAADLKTVSSLALMALVLGGLATIVGVGLFSLWLSLYKVSRPLTLITDAMRRLAGGDTGVEIGSLARGDEIGIMARAVQVFKDNAIDKVRLEKANEAARAGAEAEKARLDAIKAEEVRQQLHVVESIAHGLGCLAQGKLTYQIVEAFPGEYERLRSDFNGAMERLKETVSVVANNAIAIRAGTSDISSASDDLARRTEQQAASLEETAAALQQITETVKKTSQGASHVFSLMTQAKVKAEESGTIVSEAVAAMNSIDKSSGQMGQIIGVIDEIAFQTNLLALNAGVEAARAGEAGRGFAVVASEVRALAQRSAEAAKEIKSLILASSQEVEHGVDLVGQAGGALGAIVRSVTEITEIVAQIAAAAQEQAAGLTEINIAVSQMDKVTQQNAAMVEEATAASHGLAKETAELAKVIEGFEIGSSRAPSETRPEPAGRSGTRVMSAPVRRVANGGIAATTQGWDEF